MRLSPGFLMVRFHIYQDQAGQYRWSLIAANNEKVAASEAYVSKNGAILSARRVKQLAAGALIWDSISQQWV
jgi:uncharacterized protein YegP (UPF0339 family)